MFQSLNIERTIDGLPRMPERGREGSQGLKPGIAPSDVAPPALSTAATNV